MAECIELDIWHGDWGLPTVEPKCLAVLTYCKFSEVPVCIQKTGNPFRSPSGELPLLRHGTEIQSSTENIINYLREKHWGCDNRLSNTQCADTIAFCSLLEEKLLPAVLHLWWIDAKTYIDLTRPGFAKASPFPLNFYIPSRMRRKAKSRIYSKSSENVTDVEVDMKIYREAKFCLNLLEKKLGNNLYFFGERPSLFDAIVFGYLAPMMKAPLTSNQLQNHLLACTKLTDFCKRILHDYFPQSLQETESTSRTTSSLSEDNPNKLRNMVLAGIFAITAMVGYAFAIGLIQLEFTDHEEQEEITNVKSESKQESYDQFEPFFEDADEQE
ncbi:metaxin-1 [Octopus bimaculoides]|uniref:Metaxin n=1 Tax=Octopus bimaculoides TaxID=37653 RepID=A0A0L8FS04_OCTBM|nr:metaxin-1 [Octopus bimaculoides]|eukprot:XP_014787456.1 PREDICTED: metaxin-1-like [Octopus bimaculoides]